MRDEHEATQLQWPAIRVSYKHDISEETVLKRNISLHNVARGIATVIPCAKPASGVATGFLKPRPLRSTMSKQHSTLLPKTAKIIDATFDFVEVTFDLSKESFDL